MSAWLKDTLERALNELPTIAAGAAAVLYVFGIDIGEATLAEAVENVEGLIGFAIWLLVRANIQGPVTLVRGTDDGHSDQADPPQFTHWNEG